MVVLLWDCIVPVLCALLPSAGGLDSAASQRPTILLVNEINSSAEISCSTSKPGPEGVHLRGRFHGNRAVAYLDMRGREVRRVTVHQDFAGRVALVGEPRGGPGGPGLELTLRLSWLGLNDTDSYVCDWDYFDIARTATTTLQGHGTLLVVRGEESDPESACSGGLNSYLDIILIVSSLSFFVIILFVFSGTLVWRCTKKRKSRYTPARAQNRSQPRQQRRPEEHPHRCLHPRDQPPRGSQNPPQPYYLT